VRGREIGYDREKKAIVIGRMEMPVTLREGAGRCA